MTNTPKEDETLKVCPTCRGFGYSLGAECWTCHGVGTRPSPAPSDPGVEEVVGRLRALSKSSAAARDAIALFERLEREKAFWRGISAEWEKCARRERSRAEAAEVLVRQVDQILTGRSGGDWPRAKRLMAKFLSSLLVGGDQS